MCVCVYTSMLGSNIIACSCMLLAWPRIELHAAIASYTTNVAENTASMSPVQTYPDSSPVCQIYSSSCLFWRDLIATGDLPSLVMQLLARALNVPDAITL